MVEVIGEEAASAEDLASAEVIPVLVRRGEDVGFTETIILDAHGCGHDVGFGVDPVGGEAPDSLEHELSVGDFSHPGADELDLIGGGYHACILSESGWSVNPRETHCG